MSKMVEVKEHPMDNCQLFVQLRNLFQAYDSQTKRLNTFIYWSGNEERIDELSTKVINLLLEHELVTHKPDAKELQTLPTGREAVTHLRGVLILLLVNTAVPTTDSQSPWSLQCQHLCQQLPQLPRFLTVAIAMRCGLQQPLLEFLECGPIWATIQYYGSLNQALGHVSPDRMDALKWIAGTLKAAGRAVYADFNNMLAREMGRLLQSHLLDSPERLQMLRPTPRKVYLAKAMEMLLEVILEVLQPPPKPDYFNIYNSLSSEKDNQPGGNANGKPYAKILLDALQRIVEMVSVDVFMHWTEMASSWTLYNYQSLICYQSAAVLKAVTPFKELCKHEVCAQLLNFGQSASTFEEIVADLSIGELLAFLDGDSGPVTKDQLLLGLECLIGRPIALGNDECLETIAKHMGLLSAKHGKVILTFLRDVEEARKVMMDIKVEKTDEDEDENDDEEEEEEEEQEEEEYGDLLQLILLPIFMQCSLEDKIQLLQFRDHLNISNCFSFAAPNLHERRISFFNNLNGHSRNVEHQLLVFFFEEPEESWLALAKLAMAHRRFSTYFWNMAVHCASHASYQMSHLATQLITDADAMLKGNASSFLLSLYVHPLVLNGLIRLRANAYRVSLRSNGVPYTQEQLQAAQSEFLEACALGLDIFTASLNYPLLQRILLVLKQLESAEKMIEVCSRREMVEMRKDYWRPGKTEDYIARAINYVQMHQHLSKWRKAHVPLITQVLTTIDALRWNLSNYEWERVDVLGKAVNYWRKNINSLMLLDPEFRQQLEVCVSYLQHQEFLTDELPPPWNTNYRREFIRWVTQACAREATILFHKSIVSGTDCVLFFDLAKAVKQEDCQTANEAYIFLFGCHVKACIRFTRGRKKCHRKRELGQRLASIVDGSPKETLKEVKQKMARFEASGRTKSR